MRSGGMRGALAEGKKMYSEMGMLWYGSGAQDLITDRDLFWSSLGFSIEDAMSRWRVGCTLLF